MATKKKPAPKRAATRKDDGPAALKAMQAQMLKKPTRTLLESWTNLLSNVEKFRAARIQQAEAARAMYTWPHLTIDQVPAYIAWYYEYLIEMRTILENEIAKSPECFTFIEDDAEKNEELYLNVYLLWNMQVIEWAAEWDIYDPDAYVKMAAQAAAQEFFIGNPQNPNAQGLIQHLASIGLHYSTEDDTLMKDTLTEFSVSMSDLEES